MKSRIRRISASVDTAISFGGPSNSTSATSSGTVQPASTTTGQSSASHLSGPSLAGMSNSGQHTSQDSALGSTANTSTDQPFFLPNYNSSRSLDIQCVPESRIEKMRKLLSSPLLRKRNSSNCHSHTHHGHHTNHHQNVNAPQPSHSSQNIPIQASASSHQFAGAQPISRDANSSPSSSPSSSPAPIASSSLKTFGVSLESLAHHRHPHHQQPTYDGQESEDLYYRDPELIVVPHQKAAHILGQACAGCLTSAPSNSSSMGSIHESASSGAVHHQYDEGIPASTSPGTSSSSTTSSTSSVHGCGQGSTRGPHYMIPFIVTRICNYIETRHGLSHEGLFRVSGNAKVVERLRKSFDENGDAQLETEGDLSSATTLLKTFLRELPHPLISNGAQCLEVIKSLKKNHDICVLALKALVSQLPDENYFTLRYLMRFLNKISLRNEENRMSATNLSIVFAPNLFRVCIDTYQGLADQSMANEVVHLMITEFNEIFCEELGSEAGAEMSHDDMSIEMHEYQFGQPEFEEEPSNQNNEDFNPEYSGEGTCSRSLIDFRSETPSDVDRKRKDFQCGAATRSNIEVFYDHSSGTPSDSHSPPRSQSVELEIDPNLEEISDRLKNEPDIEPSVSIEIPIEPSNVAKCDEKTPADIIVTNSSDSVSTDDNTATTATCTGATVCSAKNGTFAPKGCNLEPGSAHMRHLSSSGDEAQDRSIGSLPMKTTRSGSCSSDCTENQHLRIHLPDDDGNGSLSHSIASDCLTDDGEESDSTTSSILDGTSGNEAGSSSSMNEPEPEALKEDITKLAEELSIEEVAYNYAVLQPITTQPSLIDFESPDHSRNNSVRTRQNKRFSSIRRKLKEFETVFKEENGYEPSFDHKMASSFARPLMLEMSTLLNVTTPSLRDIDLDASDPSKTDHYREPSPTRSAFNVRQQVIAGLNRRCPINWHGPGPCSSQNKLIPKIIPASSFVPIVVSTSIQISDPIPAPNPCSSKTGSTLTKEEIFATIFGDPAEKHLQIIRETMIYIEERNRERRSKSGCPEDLDSMTQEQILDEKLALQRALLRFEALHGRPSTPAERNIVRHVYDRYRDVKRRAANIRSDKPSTSGQIMLPSTIAPSTSSVTLAAGDLPPIIENVQMNFQSPTGQSSPGAILLEFDAEKDRASSPNSSVKKLQKSYHEMSQERLMKELLAAKQQKRNVRMVLRDFERDFFKRSGRKVEKEDRCNMSAGYNAYRHLRYKTRLIQALIKKNQELRKSLSKADDKPEEEKQ